MNRVAEGNFIDEKKKTISTTHNIPLNHKCV